MSKKDLDELKYNSIEEVDEETEKLIELYVSVYAIILKLLHEQIKKDFNQRQAQALLKKINQHLKKLDLKTITYIKNVFPYYYLIPLKDFDNIIINLKGVQKILGAEHAIHKQALKKAQNDLYRDLAKRTTFMSNQAKKIIRDNSKELLTAMIEGGTSYKTIKKELREKLIENGVSSFVDAGRKNWSIDNYVDMAVRTKSRILHNEGTINRLKEYQLNSDEYNENFDLIQISEHGSSDWCGLYEGKVYSISGKHEYYPSIEVLPNRPYEVLHPRCKHVWLPYVVGLRGEGARLDEKYQNMSLKELNKIEYEMKKKDN